jgi:hypothetical protein
LRDAADGNVTLKTLLRAATMADRRLRLELVWELPKSHFRREERNRNPGGEESEKVINALR